MKALISGFIAHSPSDDDDSKALAGGHAVPC
jgi:hypothetical protein